MAFNQAQVIAAMKAAGWNPATRTNLSGDIANANKYGLGIFKNTANKMAGPTVPGSNDATTTPAPDQPTTSDPTGDFMTQIQGLLTPAAKPAITPFDQSGFYNAADTAAAANAEIDPWAAKQAGFTQLNYDETARQNALQRAATDKNTAETVNAAGGFNSSAYKGDQATDAGLRQSQDSVAQQNLQQTLAGQQNQTAEQKNTYVTDRRNEAYQRYLQSIGALTA